MRRIRCRVDVDGDARVVTVVSKRCRPTTGRHAHAAEALDHWAYWRRELLAYAADVLPAGPGLRAPRCLGVGDDTVYLEEVVGPRESAEVAAHRLGIWQATAVVPEVEWLAGHQLAQRIAVTELDWSTVSVDARVERLWGRRGEFLDRLETLPSVLSHGDFHPGNLVATGDDMVVLDWGTLGVAPIGADVAHLMLAARTDLTDLYLDGCRHRFDPADVRTGALITAALVGASRMHWMLDNDYAVAQGYRDFVLECAARLERLESRSCRFGRPC
nr:phosphotransferase [Stackebrandtia endophytica]